MASSQHKYLKNQRAKDKKKTREEKLQKKRDKKDQNSSNDLEGMLAYVDENGNITETPPTLNNNNNTENENS